MSDMPKDWTRRVPFRRLMTPGGLLKAAVTLAVGYLVLHLLGWREYTSFLSGTIAPGAVGMRQAMMGAFYVFAYFGFVLIVPILLLASGIFSLSLRIAGRPDRATIRNPSDKCNPLRAGM